MALLKSQVETLQLAMAIYILVLHRHPIELLLCTETEKEQKCCHKCNENVIGNEIHYLIYCPYFKSQRQCLIGSYLSKPSSTNNLIKL